MADRLDRRGFLKNTLAVSGAALGIQSMEERHLLAQDKAPGTPAPQAKKAENPLPTGRIGNLNISRVICGGNLIGGWAHSRDLIYVSSLVKSYHTDQKVFETLALAEEQGINAVLTNPRSDRVINAYWNEFGGKMQWISDCAFGADIKEGIKRSVDNGAHAVYVQGGIADQMVKAGKIDYLAEALAFIKERKVPGGIGAHALETIKACVDAKLDPDFWVKTLHRDNYWSATPKENRKSFDEVSGSRPDHDQHHDNMWCIDADATITFMASIKRPWIAFKTLAAGAIHPKHAFQWCYEHGADFLCVGMFDFQIVENAIIARQALESVNGKGRTRPWMA